MKTGTFGIICEFNPFHNGHKRLLDEARARGAERIVCVMSGNAVQRGEIAVLDKYTRAKAALLSGADLVLELPYPWCAASAEFFAGAGIGILSDFCDTVFFGSESGDTEIITSAAKLASSEGFKAEYQSRLGNGEGAASAYFSMLRERIGIDFSSNDILGVEYIKAAIQNGFELDFQTVKREGDAYNEGELGASAYPSATAIRKAWNSGKKASQYIPEEAYKVFEEKISAGEMTETRELSKAMLLYFRLADPERLSRYAELDGGVANRIVSAARASKSEEEFFENLATKRYTDAKLRRAMLFALTEVTRELLHTEPFYTTLLAANEKGREILSSIRKTSKIKIITKPADTPKDNPQFVAEEKLEAVFTLASKRSFNMADRYQRGVFIK